MSWRRILVLSAILLLALVGATWFVLQRSGAATGLVRSVLARLLRADFELGGATIDLFQGRVTLDSIRVRDPMRADTCLLDGRRVEIGVETDPLGKLLAVRGFAVDGLDLDLDLTADKAPSLDSLLRPRPAEDAELHTVTPVRVEHSRLRLRLDVVPEVLQFSEVHLDLQQSRADDGGVDPRHGVLHGSARFDNLGIGVQLLGDIDLSTGRCRVQARILDLALDAALLRRLRPLVFFEVPTDVAKAHLQDLTLWLEVALHGQADVAAGASFALDDIDCTMPELPAPLRGASLRGVASTRDGGTAQLEARHLWPGADPAVVTEVLAKLTTLTREPHVELRGKGRKVPLDDTVRQALRRFANTRAIVDGLQPTAGTGDFDLYLRDPGSAGEVVDLDLALQDVALAYHGFGPPAERVSFPLPIVHANGHVHLRNQVISIEDVAAQVAPAAGGGEVTMSGHIDQNGDGPTRVSVDLAAPSLQFTAPLRAAFAELVRDDGDLYDQFQPSGAAAVRLRVRPHDEPDGDWQVTVEPLGARAQWTGFPLPLEDVRGQIVARAEGLRLDLSAAYGAAKARMQGRLLAPPDRPGAVASGAIELHIQAEGVPFDAQVERASTTLAPTVQPVWTELSPTGHTNADLRLRRAGAGAEIVYDLDLDIADARLLPKSFPMPVTRVAGEVLVHGRDRAAAVQIDALRGLLQERGGRGAELAVVGTIQTAPVYHEDLAAVIRGLDLDAELGATLERTQAVGEGTWAVLRPSGQVDVICRQQRQGEAPPRRRYTVLLRDARSDAEMLPRPATAVSGELDVVDGQLTFQDLRARMGNTIVTCRDGRVGPAAVPDRTEVAFTVTAERLPLDDAFARLFVGPLRQAVLDRQLRGALNVNGLSLKFLLPRASDQPIETVLQGQVEALDVEMLLGTRLQEVNGVVTLDESHVTRDGGALTGRWTKGSLRLFGHPLLGIQTDFVADAERFVMRRVQARLHGGEIDGRTPDGDALVYQLARSDQVPGRLSFDLEFRGVNLREFLKQCGLTGTPYHGTAVGWARLGQLNGYDFVDMDAEGELEILDGDLGTVPMFTAIYALMAEQNRPRFEQLSVHLRLADRILHLRDLTLRSPLVAVNGGGTMSMEGYVDVVLTTDTLLGGSADMLLLPPVIQMITSNLVRFHLFGHLRDLHAEQRWFAQRDPRRRRLLPVPPRLERPRRPDF